MLISLLVLASCAAPAPVTREDAAQVALASKATRVALFKNGLAFVRREVEVPAETRSLRLDELPAPVHGTFWLAADPARLVIGPGVARRSSVAETVAAGDVTELLRANVGRRLTLLVGDERLTGVLAAMPESARPAQPWERDAAPARRRELLILDTEGGQLGIAPAHVRRVESEGEPLALEYAREREAVALTVDVTPLAEGPSTLTVLYLEHGLTWAPSYAIDLTDPQRATLTAKAEVLVEAEDLEGATLELVTGYPNLQFSHVVDPIALQGDLQAFLTALAGGGGQAAVGAALLSQRVTSNVASFEDGAHFPVAGAPEPGAAVEDLFFYEVPNANVARGERGLFPLFTARVPYAHVYEWKLADSADPRYGREDDGEREEEIWHSVRLSNDGTVPWTTAPAMTMKQGRLLGQDTLTYTSVGGETTVRITRAVDVQGEQAEYELSRDPKTVNIYGRAYWKVTRRGELRVTNHKREAVALEITRRVQGEVVANPDEADTARLPDRRTDVNPTTRLQWKVPLEPGATRELGYEYTVLVRS
jgi:hypothetical protein